MLAAADGEEAVAVFRAHADEIDCIILDLTMPRLDGIGALAAIRRLRPTVCAVLSSGYSEGEALQRFGDQDISAFIQKPYSAERLCRVLQQQMHK